MSKMIALDSGHATTTPGKRTPDGFQEISFNYPTKHFLMSELKRNGFSYVDCSPDKTIDYGLTERARCANNAKANLFVSIHYNALNGGWGSHGGIETYHYNNSSNGKKLATLVQAELIKITKLRDRGIKPAIFTVLEKTTMPAILCECGFMDNKEEAALMKTAAHQKNCAIGICKGICKYFGVTYKSETTKDYKTILKEVSNYSDIWISFVKAHPEVNLAGLIEVLYYHKGN
jgi:N-acetylmuramoyl-L-alanine amidase